ncbi:MAG: gamma-glutamyl-gamma-aminobutyrate hydrolase family protein [Deltaproteobacteria bacterium]|jgi:putative glutamine amidotransferase|nr:gamma-glutamyl-gamma-aminobutyrate hydrolase family protein [Deltaproteobacteria bacterium]MBW2496435.1 gamma-glutamyl-gamma-aminobutyrate hydrolase family protein [Deltaproteobacteria bacterium]
MRRPRIGIPLGLDDRGRWRAGRDYQYIDRRYADAITRAGGTPLYLPIQPDAAPLVELLDGLLLPGGDDLPPTRTLAPDVRAELDLVSAPQLAFDEALLAAARGQGLPILGICYGMQLMVRSAGGELFDHLPTQQPEADDHRPGDPDARHPLLVEPATRLASVLDAGDHAVNTLHHQAVRRVGPAHRVAARSPDGVIEAIESMDASSTTTGAAGAWELGVQWHPEKLPGSDSDRLFRDFLERAEARIRS